MVYAQLDDAFYERLCQLALSQFDNVRLLNESIPDKCLRQALNTQNAFDSSKLAIPSTQFMPFFTPMFTIFARDQATKTSEFVWISKLEDKYLATQLRVYATISMLHGTRWSFKTSENGSIAVPMESGKAGKDLRIAIGKSIVSYLSHLNGMRLAFAFDHEIMRASSIEELAIKVDLASYRNAHA